MSADLDIDIPFNAIRIERSLSGATLTVSFCLDDSPVQLIGVSANLGPGDTLTIKGIEGTTKGQLT